MICRLIVNPLAGQGRLRVTVTDIATALHEHGVESEAVFTYAPGDTFRYAREAVERNYELVVVVGGDGTVNEVANGLALSDVRLGIMPTGTANVLARDLNIPLELEAAASIVASGAVRKIDLGVIDGHYFTLMAGLGFDAEVVSGVLGSVKAWIGAGAYILKGLETLTRYQATDLVLEMPDQTITTRGYLTVVSNSATYSYDLKITPQAALDDGVLDICLFEEPDIAWFGLARQIAEVFVNRHLSDQTIRCFRTPFVRITSDPPIQAQVDGDVFGRTPVEISVAPSALNVMVGAS
jgi:diacylglycerol kinase (ATP)